MNIDVRLACAERLRAEREQLAVTQSDMAYLGGVSRIQQWRYEHGEHAPNADYFAAVANIVDVLYVITGKRV